MSTKKVKKIKKKNILSDSVGKVYIQATFNNIIISFTDRAGNVLTWSSAGKMGFKGAKKNTPYAGQIAADDCSKKAVEMGLKEVSELYVKGTGAGRESAIRAISDSGIDINMIIDKTPIPFGGCRPSKRRRP